MDLLHALRDLGVADPAADTAAEDTARAALAREIDVATAAQQHSARRRRGSRRPGPSLPRGSRARGRIRVAVPALAVAAGAAAVIMTTGALGNGGGGSGRGATASPTAGNGLIHGRDTAYIIQRVRARLADAGQGQVDVWVQAGGNGNQGSDSTSTTRSYTDPQTGVFYQSSALDSADGTEIDAQYIVGTPVSGGKMRFVTTAVDPQQHLYAVTSDVGSPFGSTVGDADGVKQALANGQATQDGTATIDGQRTIKLTFPVTGGYSTTLYVNARTDAPVQSVSASPAGATVPSDDANVNTEQWQQAGTANIAQTQLGQIPAGFTRVSVAALHRADPAGR